MIRQLISQTVRDVGGESERFRPEASIECVSGDVLEQTPPEVLGYLASQVAAEVLAHRVYSYHNARLST